MRALRSRRAAGSSPLARGLHRHPHGDVRRRRIIPARAGFTSTVAQAVKDGSDHPRSRGVYSSPNIGPVKSPGSSPLARGLLVDWLVNTAWPWIIPARAGFTSSWRSPARVTSDHPRSRGVYTVENAGEFATSGSSPLARGLLKFGAQLLWFGRIIPARAGFTPGSLRGRAPVPDHPRSRGVYTAPGGAEASMTGSSPLARGLPLARGHGRIAYGIIPARAGFTWPGG